MTRIRRICPRCVTALAGCVTSPLARAGARGSTFGYRAGEDTVRSRLPSYIRSSIRPQKRRRPGTKARPSNENLTPLLRSGQSLASTPGQNEGRTPVVTLTGQRARSTLPACDTPRNAEAVSRSPAGLSRVAAEAAWHAVTPSIAGTPHVRISADGGRTYPARHARPLPADPPAQPCTVPVYDAGSAAGRMLALDLDPGRCLSDSAVTNRPPPGAGMRQADVTLRPPSSASCSSASVLGTSPTCRRAAAATS